MKKRTGHIDKYKSLQDLKLAERMDIIWRQRVEDRDSWLLVVAPHAGNIEFFTGDIANGIAGSDYSYFVFEGLIEDEKRCFRELHVTSTNYRDPALTLLQKSAVTTISIHGAEEPKTKVTHVGGRNGRLRKQIVKALVDAEFDAEECTSGRYSAKSKTNFVNTTADNGIQLEISRGERNALAKSHARFRRYVEVVTKALIKYNDYRIRINKRAKSSQKAPSATGYSEPKKVAVRKTILTHAVEALTTARTSSAVITADFFERNWNYAVNCIRESSRPDSYTEAEEVFSGSWKSMNKSKIGKKSAKDLNVLILSGPEPLNDFGVLQELGVSPFNIWAVEADKKIYSAAIDQLRESGLPFRIYRGSLQEFFSIVPQQFDIVYFDACGPIFSREQKTIAVLRELFLNQRLAPLSVLITNFCGVTMNADQFEPWARRLGCWYAPQYDQPVSFDEDHEIKCLTYDDGSDKGAFVQHIKDNLEEYYSDFITSFITQFCAQLLPWWRIAGLSGARGHLLADSTRVEVAVRSSKAVPQKIDWDNFNIQDFGHAGLSPSSYPMFWCADFAYTKLPNGDPLKNFFYEERPFGKGPTLGQIIQVISLVRNYFEAEHNRGACSQELRDVLSKFCWFDSEIVHKEEIHANGSTRTITPRIFCDVPMPELLVDLILGQYGYPYHVNCRKQLRLKYTAKQTPMYTDVFVVDQARYFYDFVPALELIPHLPSQMQLLLRVCMDSIGQHLSDTNVDLFRFAHLACWNEAGSDESDFRKRRRIDLDARLVLDESED